MGSLLGVWRLHCGVALSFVAGCYFAQPRPRGRLGAVAPSEPSAMCVQGRTSCRSRDALRDRLRANHTLVQAAPTPGGSQGAAVLTLRADDGTVLDAKWRALEARSRFSDPVAELAAYVLQDLLVAEADSVVPPTVLGCVDREQYRQLHHRVAEDAGRCVLGTLSFWLPDVMSLDDAREEGLVPDPSEVEPERPHGDPWLFDPERFARDAAYRRNLAHLNVLAFLMGHGDAHDGQFVVSDQPEHIYLVDNSVAFGMGKRRTMEGRQDFSEQVVPAIPSDLAERLAGLDDAALARLRALATVEWDDEGRLHYVDDPPWGDTGARLRRRDGRVQIGLSESQVNDVRSRRDELLRRIESGQLQVYAAGR